MFEDFEKNLQFLTISVSSRSILVYIECEYVLLVLIIDSPWIIPALRIRTWITEWSELNWITVLSAPAPNKCTFFVRINLSRYTPFSITIVSPGLDTSIHFLIESLAVSGEV
ncbi:MAG: hypothetical protein FMNOHCHN_03936 [Ignavibacteriaceae bacterium]|nr:hypothetical protein [Ignavibacteriaceae bacterium]